MWYDLVVIGSGPAAAEAAMAAARLGRRAAIIEPTPGGWPPRERAAEWLRAVERLTRAAGDTPTERLLRLWRPPATAAEVCRETERLIETETASARDLLEHLGIDVLMGHVAFTDRRQVQLRSSEITSVVSAERLVIATGTRSVRPAFVPFDGRRVLTIDDLPELETVPDSILVAGSDSESIDFAIALSWLGAEVTYIGPVPTDEHRAVLEVQGIAAPVEEVIAVETTKETIAVTLGSGGRLEADMLLFDAGGVGNIERLNLPAAGIGADERDRLWCDEHGQTWNPHVYGCGGVVGFPGPALSASEVVCHAFGVPADEIIADWSPAPAADPADTADPPAAEPGRVFAPA